MSDAPRLLGIDVFVPVESVPLDERSLGHVRDILAADTLSAVNGFAAGCALFTLYHAPFLPALERDGFVDVAATVQSHKLDHRHTIGLLRFLATQDIFKEEVGEVFRLTAKGRASLSRAAMGWLRMLVGGYGELMRRSLAMIKGEVQYDRDIARNPLETSMGSSMFTSAVIDAAPYRVIEQHGARTVADLGCGAGNFLIEFARRNPGKGGIGIDIAREAIDAASAAARTAGVADRVSFITGDGFDLTSVASHCRDVDIFYSFAMEHERLRLGEQAVLDHIDQMGELFAGKTYLIGEPMLHMAPHDGMFYWIHMLSMQGLPRNIPGWCQLLARLKKAKLTRVYVPEHQKQGAFFEVRLGER